MEEYAQSLLTVIQLYQDSELQLPSAVQAQIDEIDLVFLQEDLSKVLHSMRLGTERIRQIVLSLRNFSRMDEAGSKQVNLHEGIDSTLLILQHRLKGKQNLSAIEVIKEYGQLPQVECYVGQINQVLMNILSNAIDAIEELGTQQQDDEYAGKIVISTSIFQTDTGTDTGADTETQASAEWVQISIADNGSGIPDAVKQKIFNPFFTTKPIGQGTGMGLAISYQIITQNHGGKLVCQSTPTGGAELTVQLPVRLQM